MDDKIFEREQALQTTTDRRVVHLLVSDPEAPSQIENFNQSTTSTGRMGTLAVNSPSGLVMADESSPNGSLKPPPDPET
eukprot:5334782-Pleurochrysis_carterae.AAC.1